LSWDAVRTRRPSGLKAAGEPNRHAQQAPAFTVLRLRTKVTRANHGSSERTLVSRLDRFAEQQQCWSAAPVRRASSAFVVRKRAC
jgi:hypothetical protein